MITITNSAKKFISTQGQKFIILDINNKGCNGYSISWKWSEGSGKIYYGITTTLDKYMKNNTDFQLEIDYLDTPLFQGLHINVLNKTKCGCGLSFN